MIERPNEAGRAGQAEQAMPVVTICPRCKGVLAGTGRRETCPRCGEVVVAVARKLCSRCGRDITTEHRFKNNTGEYFCQACWLDVCEAAGATPAYSCSDCGGWFSAEEVYEQKNTYICRTCHEAATAEGTAGDRAEAVLTELAASDESPAAAAASAYAPSPYTASAARRMAVRTKRTRWMIGAVVAGVVVAIILFGAWVEWRR